MSSDDFYSPPSASLSDSGDPFHPQGQDFDVMGDQIRSHSPLVLPDDICVACGATGPQGKTYEKKVYYTPWWVILTVLFNIFIMLILHLITRKKLEIIYHVCPTCMKRRKNRILISVGGLVGSIAAFVIAATNDVGVLFLVGMVGFFISLIALVIFARPPVRPSAHSAGLFTIKGASPEFFDQLDRQRQETADMSTVW